MNALRSLVRLRSVRWLFLPVLGAFVMLTPVYDQYNPVLGSFYATSVMWVPGGLEVWGVMEKQRNCPIEQFHAIVYFRGDEARRPSRIRTPASGVKEDDERLLSRRTGKSAFGPWFIAVPSTAIAVNIYTGHNCWRYRLTEREMPIWRRGS